MAKNRFVNTQFWRDPFIQSLEPNGKLLYLYLFTNPDTTLCGIYEISPRTISFDTGLDVNEVNKYLTDLSSKGKIKMEGDFIKLNNHSKHQSVNPSISAGIDRELKALPSAVVDSLSTECIQPVGSLSTGCDVPIPILKPKLILKEQFLSEIEPTAEEEKKEIVTESHETGDGEQQIAEEQGPPQQEAPPRRSLFKQLDYLNAGVLDSSVEANSPDPPAPSSTPSPPVYGKVEISNMIAAIKQKVRISDFVDSKIERNMAKHCVGLMRKIGKEEFVRRLDYLLADTFHSKNCNKIKYIYNNIKGFIEPIPHVI